MEENPLLTMLVENVTKWKTLVAAIEQEKKQLKPGEDKAYEDLRDHWTFFDYDPSKCEALLSEMAKYKAKHNKDKFLENLQEFRGLCKNYYTKDKALFDAFQNAMGGKKAKQKPKSENDAPKPPPKQPPTSPQPKPQPKPQSGQQRIDYNNGDYYIGEVLNGKRHGKGTYYYANGDWDEGTFLHNNLHGYGKRYNSQYRRTDSGEFTNYIRTGKGKMVWESGGWYEGGWNSNGRHGKGVNYVAEYGRTDAGDYENDKRKGRGVMKWKDGDRYEGTWDDTSGKLNGRGMYYYSNGRSAAGEWKNGTFVESNVYGKQRESFSADYENTIVSKIVNTMMWWPWVIAAVVTIATFIQSGFWWGVLAGIIGSIAAGILMYVFAIAQSILNSIIGWFYNLGRVWKIIILLILAALIFGGSAIRFLNNTFSDIFDKSVPAVVVPAVTGTWEGTLDKNSATLVIERISDGKVSATIRVGKNSSEIMKLTGIADANNKTIELRKEQSGGNYDGQYSGVFNEARTGMEGAYTNPKTGKRLLFKFTKQE